MPSQSEILSELGAGVQLAGSAGVGGPVDGNSLGNDPTMEALWAMKAYEHAEIHFNILCVVDPAALKLTQKDQFLYDTFRKEFPDLNIAKLDESAMKSKEAKEKWRPFMMELQKEVEDYSFATLIRLDSTGEYDESNTMLVTRVQFLCIEIARNREGHNDTIRKNFKPKPRTKKSS